jgi:acetyl esterase/lipase
VILYLHGGGFMFSTPRLHARLAARLCQILSARAVMPDYRLAPEHPLPAAHEDCFTVYHWLLSEGHDPAHIVVVGDSAGGLLTLATLQRIRDSGLPLPACGVMFSPGTCVDSIRRLDARSTDGDPMIGAGVLDLLQRVVVAAVAPNDAAVSPCAGSLHGLPPLLFQAGSTELLLHQSEKAAALASFRSGRRCRTSGRPCTGFRRRIKR